MPNRKIIFIDEVNLTLERKFKEEETLKALRQAFPSMNVLVAAEFARLHARYVVSKRIESLGENYSIVGLVNVRVDKSGDDSVSYLEFCARYPLLAELGETLMNA